MERGKCSSAGRLTRDNRGVLGDIMCANVMEPWSIYDSIVICRTMYGNEQSVPGWFTSFQAFGQQQQHRFFKSRNEAGCGLAYNNMQSQDRADFAFHALSLGVYFSGPITPLETVNEGPQNFNPAIASYFMFDLPNQSAFSFKMGQDTRLDASGYHIPPGYGPRCSGMTQAVDAMNEAIGAFPAPAPAWPAPLVSTATNPTLSQATMIGTQGDPTQSNRFYFGSEIEIPRGETFEVTMSVTEHARRIFRNTAGPYDYSWLEGTGGEVPGTTLIHFPVRYVITCAIHGLREVQQRGQAHA
jgi:hypothetical protein